MNTLASQSLRCARISSLLNPLAAPRCLLQQRSTYATAASAAAAARLAEQRRTPRSFTRAPTPPPTKTTEEQLRLGYLVQRTSSVQLPLYRKLKSGKTQEVILIKKVQGDRRKMVEDIKASLAVAGDKIRINPTTHHIELQGNYFNQTHQWLLDNGF